MNEISERRRIARRACEETAYLYCDELRGTGGGGWLSYPIIKLVDMDEEGDLDFSDPDFSAKLKRLIEGK